MIRPSSGGPIALPISVKPDPPQVVLIRKFAALCTSAAKKAAISSLHGSMVSVDDTIEAILTTLWNNGYNTGLAHMDRMHRQVNKHHEPKIKNKQS